MVVDVSLELAKPPRGDLREHRTLVRNRLGHDDVERTHAIGGHQKQTVVVDDIHFTHLSAAQMPQWKGRELRDRHTRTSSARSLVCPARIGAMTLSRNSSTCSGARPMNRA